MSQTVESKQHPTPAVVQSDPLITLDSQFPNHLQLEIITNYREINQMWYQK
jgi:hypothetical protein